MLVRRRRRRECAHDVEKREFHGNNCLLGLSWYTIVVKRSREKGREEEEEEGHYFRDRDDTPARYAV